MSFSFQCMMFWMDSGCMYEQMNDHILFEFLFNVINVSLDVNRFPTHVNITCNSQFHPIHSADLLLFYRHVDTP